MAVAGKAISPSMSLRGEPSAGYVSDTPSLLECETRYLPIHPGLNMSPQKQSLFDGTHCRPQTAPPPADALPYRVPSQRCSLTDLERLINASNLGSASSPQILGRTVGEFLPENKALEEARNSFSEDKVIDSQQATQDLRLLKAFMASKKLGEESQSYDVGESFEVRSSTSSSPYKPQYTPEKYATQGRNGKKVRKSDSRKSGRPSGLCNGGRHSSAEEGSETGQPEINGPEAKDQSQAAITVQAAWRGFIARLKDPEVCSVRQELRFRRLEEHVRFLLTELHRQKQLFEQERQMRTVKLEVLKYLWKEVEVLQRWRDSTNKGQEGGTFQGVPVCGLHSGCEPFTQQRQNNGCLAEKLETGEASNRSPRSSANKQPLGRAEQDDKSLEMQCNILQQQVSQLHEMVTSVPRTVFHAGVVCVSDGTSNGQCMTSSSAGSDHCSDSIQSGSRGEMYWPQRLQVEQLNDTNFLLIWNPPATLAPRPGQSNLPLIGYRIYVNGLPKALVPASQTKLLLDGFKPKVQYKISVRGVGSLGESPDSNVVVTGVAVEGSRRKSSSHDDSDREQDRNLSEDGGSDGNNTTGNGGNSGEDEGDKSTNLNGRGGVRISGGQSVSRSAHERGSSLDQKPLPLIGSPFLLPDRQNLSRQLDLQGDLDSSTDSTSADKKQKRSTVLERLQQKIKPGTAVGAAMYRHPSMQDARKDRTSDVMQPMTSLSKDRELLQQAGHGLAKEEQNTPSELDKSPVRHGQYASKMSPKNIADDSHRHSQETGKKDGGQDICKSYHSASAKADSRIPVFMGKVGSKQDTHKLRGHSKTSPDTKQETPSGKNRLDFSVDSLNNSPRQTSGSSTESSPNGTRDNTADLNHIRESDRTNDTRDDLCRVALNNSGHLLTDVVVGKSDVNDSSPRSVNSLDSPGRHSDIEPRPPDSPRKSSLTRKHSLRKGSDGELENSSVAEKHSSKAKEKDVGKYSPSHTEVIPYKNERKTNNTFETSDPSDSSSGKKVLDLDSGSVGLTEADYPSAIVRRSNSVRSKHRGRSPSRDPDQPKYTKPEKRASSLGSVLNRLDNRGSPPGSGLLTDKPPVSPAVGKDNSPKTKSLLLAESVNAPRRRVQSENSTAAEKKSGADVKASGPSSYEPGAIYVSCGEGKPEQKDRSCGRTVLEHTPGDGAGKKPKSQFSHKRSSSAGIPALPDRPESPALKERRSTQLATPTQAPCSPRVRRSSSFSKALPQASDEESQKDVRRNINKEELKRAKNSEAATHAQTGVGSSSKPDDTGPEVVSGESVGAHGQKAAGVTSEGISQRRSLSSGNVPDLLKDSETTSNNKTARAHSMSRLVKSNSVREERPTHLRSSLDSELYLDPAIHSPRIPDNMSSGISTRRMKLTSQAAVLFSKLQLKLTAHKS